MPNANGRETHLSHKLHFKFFTQTMLNSNTLQAHLPHQPRYKFVTETMVKKNELETCFCLMKPNEPC